MDKDERDDDSVLLQFKYVSIAGDRTVEVCGNGSSSNKTGV